LAGRRGVFAEIHHQNQVAARKRAQAARSAARSQAAAYRQAEQAQRQAQRAMQQAQRAAAADQKAAEQEAKRLHQEAMEAEAAARTAALADTYDEIDSMLAASLAIDDHVDLEQLRVVAEHPPFPHPELEKPLAADPEPVFTPPAPPRGIAAAFGGKKRYADELARAQADFQVTHQAWQEQVATLPERQLTQLQEHQQAEQERLERLAEARAAYQAVCDELDAKAAASNAELDELIGGLASGEEDAVQLYIEIVLSNCVYPDAFAVDHGFEFNAETRELTMTALVPPPDQVPTERAYRYNKAQDEITATQLPKAEQRARYNRAVHQVALRSLHEIFEADRQGWVQTISLTVACESIDPATGLPRQTPLVLVAVDRPTFTEFALENVVPEATLLHVGAALSKDPFTLKPVDTSPGVRGR
jgi:restriction system protein